MSKSNNTYKQVVPAESTTSFFYEDWFMKELNDDRRKAFVPQVKINELPDEYSFAIRVQNLCKIQSSVEVEYPYLYIRIQQKEGGLLALLSRKPVVHIFARHFLIPYNAVTEKMTFVYKQDKLIIRPRKYYPDVE